MTLVKEEHWKYYLGDMPMPPDATVEMMWAAIEAIEKMDEVEKTLKEIETFTKMRDDYIYYNKNAEGSDAVKWYNEIIDFYREKLNG